MPTRDNPYGAFKYRVKLGDDTDEGFAAGFSEVSGIASEVKFSEYRNGNDLENHVRKIANVNSTEDVTLKRGVIGDLRLFQWLDATRDGDFDPRTVVIVLMDERNVDACSWTLHNAQPKKWVGPTLTGKGGGDVAMEELHLVAESIDFRNT
ncbi:phage tail protein [Streptomyces kanamyceticus]|uniref:Phage tail protein n=1 Tax=Streptomyces kanamyceticus TaxID=1967 RepID=A0A5J6GR34_STRKN|nr:phage tail protein [Streptomyces kanamyceticus]QEU96641.1 phage tail protein [Streptomyces kanamyceticus]